MGFANAPCALAFWHRVADPRVRGASLHCGGGRLPRPAVLNLEDVFATSHLSRVSLKSRRHIGVNAWQRPCQRYCAPVASSRSWSFRRCPKWCCTRHAEDARPTRNENTPKPHNAVEDGLRGNGVNFGKRLAATQGALLSRMGKKRNATTNK